MRDLTILKLGGELLEEPERLRALASSIAQLASTRPLVIVHGGGREIDAECARRGIPKRMVDGLRITDDLVLEAVIAVLAGTVNTRLTAALVAAHARAVGLTGVDASLLTVEPAPPLEATDGRLVDLGLVGQPVGKEPPAVLLDLLQAGYVPTVATLGVSADGQLFNVNADTMAAHLSVTCHASRLLLAGGTAGVLDADQQVIPVLDAETAHAMTADGRASAGMVAKLTAGFSALDGGVSEVFIVDGRSPVHVDPPSGTRLVVQVASSLQG